MRRRFMSDAGFKESFDYNNYMTIETLEDNTSVSFTSDIEYGIDGQGWRRLPYGSKVIVNAGQLLSFKGNLTPSNTSGIEGIGTFTISKNCNLVGNCMSLLFGDTVTDNFSLEGKDYAFYRLFETCPVINVSLEFLPATMLASYCYQYMFNGCTSLTTAPELPATTLANSCYNSMFQNCSSLTTAPELPATTLANYCYVFMLNGCSSLTTAPELPATTLANYCYYHMFAGCTSLTTAPELPATTLSSYCYNGMFYNCSSLTTAPALPATTLVAYCYYGMFSGCSSLTAAPELPATTLSSYCYRSMLYGCKKLNYIKMLATNISATDCLYYWVTGVASTGTFVKHPDMTSLPTGANGIPSGWTVVNDGEDSVNLITFTVNGTEYQAEEGMTWGEFINSEYNVNGVFYIDYDNSIGYGDDMFGLWVGTEVDYVYASHIIEENYNYLLVG